MSHAIREEINEIVRERLVRGGAVHGPPAWGLDDPQPRHIDRAWASTVHAFQGRTVDTVIAAMEANHPHLTTQKTLYVEISRDRAELVTDDRAALKEQLEAVTGDRIAALEAVEPERVKTLEAERDFGKDAGRESGASVSQDRERGPEPTKSVDRRLSL